MYSHFPSIATSTGLLEGTAPGRAGRPWMTVIKAALAGTANAIKANHNVIDNSLPVIILHLSVFEEIKGKILMQ